MRLRLLSAGGAVLVAAAVAFFFTGGGDSADDTVMRAKVTGAAPSKPVEAAPSPREAEPVEALLADPEDADEPADGLVLNPPEDVSGWDGMTFGAEWSQDDGGIVHGVVDLQRVDGEEWRPVTHVELGPDGGSVDIDVDSTGIFRLGYGGSGEVGETVSNDVTVVVDDELLPSRVTATVERVDDGTAEVIATWTTESGIAIIGDLELQELRDDEWETVDTVTTTAESTAEIELEADEGSRFRFVYEGGPRFEAVESEAAVMVGEDVRTIPVSACTTNTEIDNLAHGAACHYTPVQSGTFVVAHDYLGNAWWNAMPMGTIVELDGVQGGVYEVVERVIAPGRGAALGSASNWTCGDECDVILQTCQGSNTGFTWLRKLD